MTAINHLFREPFGRAEEEFYFADPALGALRPIPLTTKTPCPKSVLSTIWQRERCMRRASPRAGQRADDVEVARTCLSVRIG